MNIKVQQNNSLPVMNLFAKRGLKSTEEKLERQAKCNNQVAFFEKQKENLKNVKCDTVEEIARKLEMFHTYEDEIAAAKAAYNSEQMFHITDEAEEMGEKIAENAKKTEPKTPEERKKEAAKEAGKETEETGDGILEEMLGSVEMLEEAQQEAEDLSEQTAEDLSEQMAEDLSERTAEDLSERATEELSGQRTEELFEQTGKELSEREAERISEQTAENLSGQRTEETLRGQEEAWKRHYRPIDFFA